MIKNRLHDWRTLLLFGVVFILFVYFRAKPIYYQTVPYTYDQGRDFLKAEEIVRFKNPTFIGPTTGIQGVNHGVWWYYFLSIQYFVFQGSPSGFYWGVLGMMLITTLLFTIFLRKEFGNQVALLFLLIVTISPYFVGISFFAANNILAPPFVLLFIFSAYELFKTKANMYVFFVALSLSFIFESEMPFGLFIIPAFFTSSLFFAELRSIYKRPRQLLLLVSGLSLPLIFRALFEIKHNFSQIKGILLFLSHPSETNAQGFDGILHDRAVLFLSYFQEIFYDNNKILVFGAVIILLGILICGYKKLSTLHQRVFAFFTGMIGCIFLFSLIYRNNFFWDYYLEGIHYLFVFCILLLAYASMQLDQHKRFITAVIGLFSLLTIVYFGQELVKRNQAAPIGLRADIGTINAIYSLVGKNDFCARIYTPPVVPYTYNYLFHYYSLHGYKVPLENPINDKCVIVVDPDAYEFRIREWRKNNIPENFSLHKTIKMQNKVQIELWTKK